jgi:hypothetical protein
MGRSMNVFMKGERSVYEQLVKDLREDAEWAEANQWETPICLSDHLKQAADAIEKLSKNEERRWPFDDV